MDEMSAKEYVTLQTLMASGKDVDEALAEVRKRYAPLPEEPPPKKKKKKSKYGNVRVEAYGRKWDSKAELRRYEELLELEKDGSIHSIECQPRYPIRYNGELLCTYVADFRYTNAHTGEQIVEDVKGVRTSIFILKKKLVKAFYGIDVQEIT